MSLLSPFNFGQKHSYFHVQLTIHELDSIPLVTGLFACKWKFKGAHSLASLQHASAAAVHQSASRAVSGAVRKAHPPSASAKDAAKDVRATDHDSGATGTLDNDPPHEKTHTRRQASASSHADAASILSQQDDSDSLHTTNKSTLLNGLLHPHKHSTKADAHSESPSTAHSRSADRAVQSNSQASTSSTLTPSEASSSSPTTRRDSTTSRKTTHSRPKSLKDIGRHKSFESSNDHTVDPLLFFSQEPKGETDFVNVANHKVEWERDVQIGVRIGIGKPKASGPNDSSPNSSRRDSPAVSAKSSAKDLKSRAHRDQHLEDMSTAWGRLTDSQLKLTIKQQMPANAKSTTHPSVLGHVVLDLSEFAPDPPTASSNGRRSHHHHHHHHHAHHHHHHPNLASGEHSYRDRTHRSETRKFLLNESRTNATVKITVSMTYLGGEREYYVPPISNGLMVNGLGSIMAPTLLELNHDAAPPPETSKASSSESSTSESSSLRNESVRASASVRDRGLMGQGLPSASSLSLGRLDSYGRSQHSLYGPPLKSIYAKKTWTSRIPEENLIAADKVASGSSVAKKKTHRASEAPSLSGRNQGDRAPEDLVDAIFKGIPVGGSHNGKTNDEAAPAKAAAARAGRVEHAANRADSQGQELRRKPSHSPERTRDRRSTLGSGYQHPKKPDRSFSFGLGFSSKDKDKDKDKEKEKEKGRGKDKKGHQKCSKNGSATDLESLAGDKKPRSTHLTVPGSGADTSTPGLAVDSPSASSHALDRSNSEAAIPTLSSAPPGSSFRRVNAVRWKFGGDEGEPEEQDASSQETTPVAETFDSKEQRDRAAMPPPPSVIVEHAHIPIRARGIAAASAVALQRTQADIDASEAGSKTKTEGNTAADGQPMLSPPIVSTSTPASKHGADAASIHSMSSINSAAATGKKVSSNDLKSKYEAGLSIPQSLSNSTSVGLDRLKRTSRAIGQFAKDAARSGRPPSRPNSSSGTMSFHDSQGVSGRQRRSKGNHGIEPSEAASKGWRGAGWLRPISTAPAPLPPCSPHLSSSSEDGEFEDASDDDANAKLAGSRISNSSEDGRRSSNTDQTIVSDTAAPSPVKYRPAHKREDSLASIYHDTEESPSLVGTYLF